MQFGVGQPVPRTEDPKFLMGQGQYVDDVNLHGQLYGYVLRSPHAHARIRSIDTSAAEAMPEVKGIVTRADFNQFGQCCADEIAVNTGASTTGKA